MKTPAALLASHDQLRIAAASLVSTVKVLTSYRRCSCFSADTADTTDFCNTAWRHCGCFSDLTTDTNVPTQLNSTVTGDDYLVSKVCTGRGRVNVVVIYRSPTSSPKHGMTAGL